MNWKAHRGVALLVLGFVAFVAVWWGAPQIASLGSAPGGGWDTKTVKTIGSVVVSVVLGALAIFLILRPPNANTAKDREWAFATLGMIGGYWLPAK